MQEIYFKNISKYKYELVFPFQCTLPEIRGLIGGVSHEFFQLSSGWNNKTPVLVVREGYQWDGPSGPTIDTHDFMTASLVHDVLYQIIRERLFMTSNCSTTAPHILKEVDGLRRKSDKIMYRICRDFGMPWFRAQYVYRAVRWFGGAHV